MEEQFYKLKHWISRQKATEYEHAEMKAIAEMLMKSASTYKERCDTLEKKIEALEKA